ncbi:MAG: histidine kinase [Bacteroidota bacterium]
METSSDITLLSAILPFIAIVFIITIGVILLNLQFKKNIYKQQLLNEELKNKHQLDLLQTSIAVQEGERKRIAANLHDELGAILSISRMRMVQLEGDMANDPHTEALSEIRSYIETSIVSMRRISHELIPPQLEQFGLISTLESITEQLSKTKEITVTLSSNNNIPELSWSMQLGLFRVLMEFMNNTIKHAHASEIHIDLSCYENILQCLYRDNGIGLHEGAPMTGLGFRNIEGRINALEGQLIIGGSKAAGFTASIQIPLKNNID